jgi:hypothetical protein
MRLAEDEAREQLIAHLVEVGMTANENEARRLVQGAGIESAGVIW